MNFADEEQFSKLNNQCCSQDQL